MMPAWREYQDVYKNPFYKRTLPIVEYTYTSSNITFLNIVGIPLKHFGLTAFSF
jgi:hypothetical protein